MNSHFWGVSFSLLECVPNFLQGIKSLLELHFFENCCDEDIPKLQNLPNCLNYSNLLLQKFLIFNPHNRITARDSLQHPYFKDELESIRTSSSLSESESLDTSDCRSDTPVSKWCWKLGTSQNIVLLTPNSLNPAVSFNSETLDCSIIWNHSLLCEFVILMSETNQIL